MNENNTPNKFIDLSYFEKLTIFDSIDKFYYLMAGLIIIIFLTKNIQRTELIFYIIIIVLIILYLVSNYDFNTRNLLIQNVNEKYDKFKRDYKYLWMDANIILYLDSILFIRNYTENNYDDLVKEIDNFLKIQYDWEFNHKEKNIDDYKLYIKFYKNILNTYQTFYVSCPSSEKYNLTMKQNELYELLKVNLDENVKEFSEGWFILNLPNYDDRNYSINKYDLFK
jgi:hypothetical protein